MDAETVNLNDVIFVGKVDDAELAYLLLTHFRHSCSGLSNEVRFYRANGPGAVKLTYRKGKIESAAGIGLKPEEITLLADKVKGDLLESPGTTVARCILLATYRVKGCFVYGDKLRILPVPEHAPNAPDLTEEQVFSEHLDIEHHFIVEFPLTQSISPIIQLHRLERAARRNALLLNVFLEGTVSRSSPGQQQHWIHEEGADLSSSYKYLREGYRFPGFFDIGPGFADTANIPQMETMEYYEYFSNPRQELNAPMRVPVLLATFLDRFGSLARSDQERFMRSAHWFHHTSNVWQDSKSAAYLAIISSIETLRPAVPPSEKCEKCGSPLRKGVTKQFVECLDGKASASKEDVSVMKELYRLRSALTHGGDLFHADTQAHLDMNPKSTAEAQSYYVAMSLARRALLGWLMRKTGGWPVPS